MSRVDPRLLLSPLCSFQTAFGGRSSHVRTLVQASTACVLRHSEEFTNSKSFARMADPDLIMVDAQPAPQLRPYTIPDAPELPYKWDNYTNQPVSERWADVRKNLTARIRSDYTGFDVREINHADPTGMGRRHIHDWPASFPLGPPSEAPDYHPILEKYGLKILNRAGFINDNFWKEDAVVGPSGLLAFAPFRNPGVDEDEMLHPILRRDMWKNVTNSRWALMEPSLRLASAILDDSKTLAYFYALGMPSDQMKSSADPYHNGRICKELDPIRPLDPQELEDTFKKLVDLRKWTGNTSTSWINMHEGIVDVLEAQTKATRDNPNGNYYPEVQSMPCTAANMEIDIDVTSAHARTAV
ncbi:hypothetical protein E4T43_04738 [Aureobasidium subglaciale]|nr:hypothetical protein E4T43_04738 [Aureobasidium subglaciale]